MSRRGRLATESTEEREVMFQQRWDGLAAETAEERETRVQRMRAHDSDRLAAEITEERRRLQQRRDIGYRNN